MSYGFLLDTVPSSVYGLSLADSYTTSAGSGIVAKTYSDLVGYDFFVSFSVSGSVPIATYPIFPSYSVSGNTVTVDPRLANVATNVLVLCR